jgi:hypothetical protein
MHSLRSSELDKNIRDVTVYKIIARTNVSVLAHALTTLKVAINKKILITLKRTKAMKSLHLYTSYLLFHLQMYLD